MTTLYKLTTQDNKTRPGKYNECVWGPGITHSGTGEGGLCGPGWIHAYTDPLLAALLNPYRGDFPDPKLWVAEGEVAKTDRGLKVGCRSLTTVREIPLPRITHKQKVRFAILCVLEIPHTSEFAGWAVKWLSGEDRSIETVVKVKMRAREISKEAWATGTAEEAWAAEVAWATLSAASLEGEETPRVRAGAVAATEARLRAASDSVAQAAEFAVSASVPGQEIDLITLARKAVGSGSD